ncbi:MAG: glycosyltransferase [Actinobacteria bacterium 13_2_20CM_2_71_6]|nr:MAG: glycosyltransferase [Actinobacteria bacterium 13_2_20CM_2_71_6]
MTTRVALVLAASTGGIGRHVASLAAGLTARGIEVSVVGPAATDERFDFTGRGAVFMPVDTSAGPAAVAHLRRALVAIRPDVVHAHGLRAGLVSGLSRPHRRAPATADMRPNRPAPVPLVVTWHNAVLAEGLRGTVFRLLERRVARAADVTLGASADLVARATALGGRDVRLGAVAAPELAAPARSGADVREELGVAEGQPLVLSVGRLHPQKGYDILIAAASRWRTRTPAPVVAVAGTGPAYLHLAALASSERAPVALLGHRSDVPDLLGAADLAVVTSVWEARQLFAQEALRAGVPLVATGVGGLPELVGDAAVLVPPKDVDALDAAVTALLDDPARRAELAERGRDRAATWPTEQQTVDRVRAVYAELTGQPAER